MRKSIVPVALAAMLAATAVQAQSDPRIDRRQAIQRDRIQQGIASGDLTRREAGHLIAQQRDIRRTERHFAADGRIGPRERAVLDRRLDHSSRSIYRQRHDAQRHGFYGHRPRAWHGGRHGFYGRPFTYGHVPRHFGHRHHPRPYVTPWGLHRPYYGHRFAPRHYGPRHAPRYYHWHRGWR